MFLLAATAGAVLVLGVDVLPTFTAIGVGGTLGVEVVAYRGPKRIRSAARHEAAAPVAAVVGALAVAGGVVLAPAPVLSTMLGAIAAYLALLAAAATVAASR